MTNDSARIAALTLQVAALRKALEDLCGYFSDWYNTPDDQVYNEAEHEIKVRIGAALSLPAPSPSKVAALVEAALNLCRNEDDILFDSMFASVPTEDWDALCDAARNVTGKEGT